MATFTPTKEQSDAERRYLERVAFLNGFASGVLGQSVAENHWAAGGSANLDGTRDWAGVAWEAGYQVGAPRAEES